MDFFNSIIDKFLDFVLKALPTSPFSKFIDTLEIKQEWLGYLNWFLPIGFFLKVMGAWLGAIALFYAYSVILRWVRAIS